MEYFNKNVDFSGENLRNIDTKIAQRKQSVYNRTTLNAKKTQRNRKKLSKNSSNDRPESLCETCQCNVYSAIYCLGKTNNNMFSFSNNAVTQNESNKSTSSDTYNVLIRLILENTV